MTARIDLVTIIVEDIQMMKQFYQNALGFVMKTDVGEYVEFATPGVRFSLCERHVLADATHHASYSQTKRGQSFELAFPFASPAEVDAAYTHVVAVGGTPVQGPTNMPWGQRTAFFADPEGNIHELFAEVEGNAE
ncbi:MAG: VOC family protein [Ktedonobacterales bacterium]